MSDKRELILTSAVRVFARHGFDRTPVDAVAKEAGVAVGTIYNYFGSKAELLAEIFTVEHDRRRRRLQEVLAEPTPAAERLIKGLRAHVAAAIEDDSVARLVLQEGLNPAPCHEGRATRGGVLREFVGAVLTGSELSERLAPDQIAGVALLLVGSVQALVEEYVRSEDRPEPDDCRLAIADGGLDALELLIRGLMGENT